MPKMELGLALRFDNIIHLRATPAEEGGQAQVLLSGKKHPNNQSTDNPTAT